MRRSVPARPPRVLQRVIQRVLRKVVVIGLLVASVPLSPSPAQRSTATKSKFPANRVVNNPFRVGRTLVIAHAGGDGLFPENTLYAYEQAAKLGNDVIDIDIQLTKDGVPIAFHDPTVDRTTEGSGRVRDFTVGELKQFDAGYDAFPNQDFPFRNKGLRVVTLDEVLARFPTTLTTLDLKDQRIEVVKPVCQLLRQRKRTVDVYVGIDAGEQVLAFRQMCPEVRTSGTGEERQWARAERDAGRPGCTKQLVSQPGYYNGRRRVTATSIAAAHRCNTAVLTWVIDDPKTMRGLIDAKIDGIYTRRPDLLAPLVRK
jgi:glycerophosphoryl diester phosphodiesterase